MDIRKGKSVQTVMVTYDVGFGTFDELLAILETAYDDFISRQKGFVDAAIHVNDAKTRIASYSHWEKRDDFLSVLRSAHMQKVNKQLADLSKGFEPVLYEISNMYSAKV
jgi:quinol monooxygenase YgiN